MRAVSFPLKRPVFKGIYCLKLINILKNNRLLFGSNDNFFTFVTEKVV